MEKKKRRTKKQKIALGVRMLSKMLYYQAKSSNEPLPEMEPFALFIDDIKIFRLSAFIKCFVHQDYSVLKIAGEPTEKQYIEAWDHIKNQFYDASGNEVARQSNNRQKEINGYIIAINRVRMLMDALRAVNDVRIQDELREDGFNYEYTDESLESDLLNIENELVTWEVKKDELVALENEYQAKGGNKPIDDNFFLEQLAELRKFEGYNTPVVRLADEMTVYDYCISLKRYNEHAKLLEAQHGTR